MYVGYCKNIQLRKLQKGGTLLFCYILLEPTTSEKDCIQSSTFTGVAGDYSLALMLYAAVET